MNRPPPAHLGWLRCSPSLPCLGLGPRPDMADEQSRCRVISKLSCMPSWTSYQLNGPSHSTTLPCKHGASLQVAWERILNRGHDLICKRFGHAALPGGGLQFWDQKALVCLPSIAQPNLKQRQFKRGPGPDPVREEAREDVATKLRFMETFSACRSAQDVLFGPVTALTLNPRKLNPKTRKRKC